MLYKNHNDPDQIWIAFISVPYENKSICYHAENLAQEIQHSKSIQFSNEHPFEWGFLKEYIVHKV